MADFYKLEKDVAKLFEMVESIDKRVSEIEARRVKAGRDNTEKVRAKRAITECLVKMEGEGIAEFEGVETNAAAACVMMFAKINGIDGINDSRGERTQISYEIKSRYGLDIVHGKFVKPDGDRQ